MSPKLRNFYYIIFFLSASFYTTTVAGQNWRWVVNATGNHQYSDADRDIAVDNVGTQFVAGYFTETLQLGAFTLENPDDYYSDMYLAKIDSGGRVIWAKAIELGSSYAGYMGICLGDSNNIFLTGSKDGRVFVSKYDSSGALQWNSNINSKWYGYGSDIAVNQNDEVYISAAQSGNGLVAKLNYDGELQWFHSIVGCHSNGAMANDLAVDRLGNCYMAGSFECDSIIVGNYILRKQIGYAATYVVKYLPNGTVSWANAPVGQTNATPQIALSPKGSHLILSGGLTSDLTFDGLATVTPYLTTPSSYLAQYDTSGKPLWAKRLEIYKAAPADIVLDYDDNIYFGGVSFGNWGGTEMDFHIAKYNPVGEVVYQQDVLAGWEELYGLDIDNNGNSYLVGHTDVLGLGMVGEGYVNANSVFAAKVNTGGTTRRRPGRPSVDHRITVCKGGKVPQLHAGGTNIRWYKDQELTQLLASTAAYQPTIITTDTFYVTQTTGNITSWPKQVIVYFSTITPFEIVTQQDSLYAPKDSNYAYQWYRDSIPLADSVGGQLQGIRPATMGKYTVLVNDRGCKQQASTFFYFDKCPGGVDSFVSNIAGFRYAWEVSANGGASYYPLVNNGNYAGVTTRTLTIKNYPTAWRNYLYRCLVTEFYSNYSHAYQLLFQTKWTGAVDHNWGNAGNWSCGAVPDMFTDILIGTGEVVIQSDAEARSVRVINGATLTVNEGATLRVVK